MASRWYVWVGLALLMAVAFAGGVLYNHQSTAADNPLPRWVWCEHCGDFTCTDKTADTQQSVSVEASDFRDNDAECRSAVIGGVAMGFPLVVRAN